MEEELKKCGGIDGGVMAVPGLRLCVSSGEYAPGDGTFEDGGYIYSSLAGFVKLTEIPGETKTQKVDIVPCGGGATLARVGETVTAVIARVSSRAARCELRCAGPRTLTRPLRAILKKESVRATEIDRIDMYKCFRPGDIILARVLPITELQCYQLSTAEPDLGVVIARAANAPPGVNMVPITWSEMQCPVTLVKEPRKVAKVAPENVREILEGVEKKISVKSD